MKCELIVCQWCGAKWDHSVLGVDGCCTDWWQLDPTYVRDSVLMADLFVAIGGDETHYECAGPAQPGSIVGLMPQQMFGCESAPRYAAVWSRMALRSLADG